MEIAERMWMAVLGVSQGEFSPDLFFVLFYLFLCWVIWILLRKKKSVEAHIKSPPC